MLAPLARHPEETVSPHEDSHRPVLLREVVETIRPAAGSVIVDATVGPGGHAEALLDAVGTRGRVYGIDRDPEALAHASRRLTRFGSRFVPLRGNHGEIRSLLDAEGVFAVDGLLADLGVSSLQLGDPERGFSFRLDGPLDMRMDRTRGASVADLLATLSEADLKRILQEYGEERRAGPIARAVVQARAARGPFQTTRQLADLVERVVGPGARRYHIHPATRTFQALRIAVNREMESIERLLNEGVALLRRGGRLVVISFHSLEDRAVKRGLRALAQRCTCPPGLPVCACGKENLVRILTNRPLTPSAEEVERNPRARSSRLRAAERL